MRKAKLKWDVFLSLVKELANKIPKNRSLFGIPRNGTLVALCLSHQRPDLKLLYEDPRKLAHEGKLNNPCSPIILDDIFDQGKTLKSYIDDGFEVATLFTRGKVPGIITAHVMDTDHWIIFPWEREDEKEQKKLGR